MNKKRCLVIVAVAMLLLASSCAASLITILEAEPNWTAPNMAGDVTVTVKVLDEVGNWVRKSIVFEVVYCESCVFW